MTEPTYTSPNGTFYIAGGRDANCTISACPIELSNYGYRPSIGASGALIGLYAICMVVQTALGWRYRSWGYTVAMVLGCIDEILGYAGRILLWQDPWGRPGFIMQIGEIFLLPCPTAVTFSDLCSPDHHRARLLLGCHLRDALSNVSPTHSLAGKRLANSPFSASTTSPHGFRVSVPHCSTTSSSPATSSA